MKVSNDRDPSELSHVHRPKKGEKSPIVHSPGADAGASGGVGGLGDPASVSISSEAKSISAANQAARAEETDQAKIDRIKAMIHGGTYKPDYGKVADKMVNEHMLQELG